MSDVCDDVALLRLAWHPADFEGGCLLGSHFSSDDLEPTKDANKKLRYLSVDQKLKLIKESVDSRIQHQQRDNKRIELQREEARFVEYQCAHINALIDSSLRKPLKVREEPLKENPGHCGIHNTVGPTINTKSARRRYVQELRTLLVQNCRHSIHTYVDIFPEGIDG